MTTGQVVLSTGKITSGAITSSVMTTGAEDSSSDSNLNRQESGLIAGVSVTVVTSPI